MTISNTQKSCNDDTDYQRSGREKACSVKNTENLRQALATYLHGVDLNIITKKKTNILNTTNWKKLNSIK